MLCLRCASSGAAIVVHSLLQTPPETLSRPDALPTCEISSTMDHQSMRETSVAALHYRHTSFQSDIPICPAPCSLPCFSARVPSAAAVSHRLADASPPRISPRALAPLMPGRLPPWECRRRATTACGGRNGRPCGLLRSDPPARGVRIRTHGELRERESVRDPPLDAFGAQPPP